MSVKHKQTKNNYTQSLGIQYSQRTNFANVSTNVF